MRSELQHRSISRDDRFGKPRDSALQNTIVSVIRQNAQSRARAHPFAELGDEDCYARELLSVTAELPRENAEELVENVFGEEERISTVDDPRDRPLGGSARND